jgi:hypothetical protein
MLASLSCIKLWSSAAPRGNRWLWLSISLPSMGHMCRCGGFGTQVALPTSAKLKASHGTSNPCSANLEEEILLEIQSGLVALFGINDRI